MCNCSSACIRVNKHVFTKEIPYFQSFTLEQSNDKSTECDDNYDQIKLHTELYG